MAAVDEYTAGEVPKISDPGPVSGFWPNPAVAEMLEPAVPPRIGTGSPIGIPLLPGGEKKGSMDDAKLIRLL
eukprot:CAMPEP_0175044116 /NCGR_PEP_ID=MMETSP0052_2-20121109/3610_1 /TAXON_ID=51329 ORGANISM="Polytomella parva, Strain SAG 63-3" /NCGR_SAMPLE_ID=MMETSP0052_2 /ASSEMBLY_ACC=CAM_ASM_000194 /LENGTH=71 /DNA_ID=CAMNT_0016307343 /DNA_START=814 /DNA_END=1025 /DNA_ORIENTATION=-